MPMEGVAASGVKGEGKREATGEQRKRAPNDVHNVQRSKQASRGHTATHSPPLYPAPYVRIHLTTPSHPNHDGSGTFDLVCEADGSACTAHEAVLDAYFPVRVVHYIGVNHNHNRRRPGTSPIIECTGRNHHIIFS